MMTTRKYQVRFVTPAFLGDFEQAGRWRTPPFKALLRPVNHRTLGPSSRESLSLGNKRIIEYDGCAHSVYLHYLHSRMRRIAARPWSGDKTIESTRSDEQAHPASHLKMHTGTSARDPVTGGTNQ